MDVLKIGTVEAASVLSSRRFFTELPKVIGQSIVFRLLIPEFRKVPSRIVPVFGSDGSKYYAPFPDVGPEGSTITTMDGIPFSECPLRNRYRFLIWNYATEQQEVLEVGVNLASRINNILADPDVGFTWDTAVFKLVAIAPRTPAIPRDYDVQIIPKRSGEPIPADILERFEKEKGPVMDVWGNNPSVDDIRRRVEAWKGESGSTSSSTSAIGKTQVEGDVVEFEFE